MPLCSFSCASPGQRSANGCLSVSLAAAVLSGLILACPAAGAQGTPTTSTLTVTGSQPYNLSCNVGWLQANGAGPTGTVTFTDVTTGQTLATETLGAPTPARYFAESVVPLPSGGGAAAVGDFNGDGIPDLITTDAANIYVLPGNGDGTFKPAITTPVNVSGSPGLGGGPGNIVTGDFNNDGKLDIVGDVQPGDGQPSRTEFFAGNGDGTFAQPVQILSPDGNQFQPYLWPVDLAGNGVIDLVDRSPNLIWLNNGNGISYTSVPYSWTWSGITGDFRGDGKLDVVVPVVGTSGYVTDVDIYLGNGDGTFQSPVDYGDLGAHIIRTLTPGFFNNDGHLDLLVGESTNSQQFSLLLGNGDGTFQNGYSYTIPSGLDDLDLVLAGSFAEKGNNGFVAIGFSGHYGDAVQIFSGNGNATFVSQAVLPIAPVPAMPYPLNPIDTVFNSTDFDGDGFTDLYYFAENTGSSILGAHILLNRFFGTASASVSDLTVSSGGDANQVVQCSYSGDANYAASTSGQKTISFQTAPEPVFSLRVGQYASAQTVTITDALSGSTIYYTSDGSTPTVSSTPYTGPISVSSTVTLKAIATSSNSLPSAVSEVVYTVTNSPSISLPAGSYSTAQQVSLSDATPNATIYYTTDGSTPGGNSTQYSVAITLSSSTTLNAIALAPGSLFSSIASSQYTISLPATTTSLVPSATGSTLTSSGGLNPPITLTATVSGHSPTGTVAFAANGKALGTAPVSAGSAALQAAFAGASTYSVTANYSGDSANAASASTAVSIVIAPAVSSVSLQASINSANENQSVTLTASVTGYNPTGTVTFLSGTTSLGSASVSAGSASLITSFAAAGSDSLTAQYSGDANNQPSTSAAVGVTVLAPSYAVAANPATQTIAAGQSASFTITVTPSGGYSGTTSFACSSVPSGASCIFSPSTVTPSGVAASTTLTISTTPPSSAAAQPGSVPWRTGGSLVLAGLLGIFLRPRRAARWLRTLCCLLLLGALAFCSACGGGGSNGGGSSNPGTPAGTYSVSVNATGSGGTNQTLAIQLIVH